MAGNISLSDYDKQNSVNTESNDSILKRFYQCNAFFKLYVSLYTSPNYMTKPYYGYSNTEKDGLYKTVAINPNTGEYYRDDSYLDDDNINHEFYQLRKVDNNCFYEFCWLVDKNDEYYFHPNNLKVVNKKGFQIINRVYPYDLVPQQNLVKFLVDWNSISSEIVTENSGEVMYNNGLIKIFKTKLYQRVNEFKDIDESNDFIEIRTIINYDKEDTTICQQPDSFNSILSMKGFRVATIMKIKNSLTTYSDDLKKIIYLTVNSFNEDAKIVINSYNGFETGFFLDINHVLQEFLNKDNPIQSLDESKMYYWKNVSIFADITLFRDSDENTSVLMGDGDINIVEYSEIIVIENGKQISKGYSFMYRNNGELGNQTLKKTLSYGQYLLFRKFCFKGYIRAEYDILEKELGDYFFNNGKWKSIYTLKNLKDDNNIFHVEDGAIIETPDGKVIIYYSKHEFNYMKDTKNILLGDIIYGTYKGVKGWYTYDTYEIHTFDSLPIGINASTTNDWNVLPLNIGCPRSWLGWYVSEKHNIAVIVYKMDGILENTYYPIINSGISVVKKNTGVRDYNQGPKPYGRPAPGIWIKPVMIPYIMGSYVNSYLFHNTKWMSLANTRLLKHDILEYNYFIKNYNENNILLPIKNITFNDESTNNSFVNYFKYLDIKIKYDNTTEIETKVNSLLILLEKIVNFEDQIIIRNNVISNEKHIDSVDNTVKPWYDVQNRLGFRVIELMEVNERKLENLWNLVGDFGYKRSLTFNSEITDKNTLYNYYYYDVLKQNISNFIDEIKTQIKSSLRTISKDMKEDVLVRYGLYDNVKILNDEKTELARLNDLKDVILKTLSNNSITYDTDYETYIVSGSIKKVAMFYLPQFENTEKGLIETGGEFKYKVINDITGEVSDTELLFDSNTQTMLTPSKCACILDNVLTTFDVSIETTEITFDNAFERFDPGVAINTEDLVNTRNSKITLLNNISIKINKLDLLLNIVEQLENYISENEPSLNLNTYNNIQFKVGDTIEIRQNISVFGILSLILIHYNLKVNTAKPFDNNYIIYFADFEECLTNYLSNTYNIVFNNNLDLGDTFDILYNETEITNITQKLEELLIKELESSNQLKRFETYTNYMALETIDTTTNSIKGTITSINDNNTITVELSTGITKTVFSLFCSLTQVAITADEFKSLYLSHLFILVKNFINSMKISLEEEDTVIRNSLTDLNNEVNQYISNSYNITNIVGDLAVQISQLRVQIDKEISDYLETSENDLTSLTLTKGYYIKFSNKVDYNMVYVADIDNTNLLDFDKYKEVILNQHYSYIEDEIEKYEELPILYKDFIDEDLITRLRLAGDLNETIIKVKYLLDSKDLLTTLMNDLLEKPNKYNEYKNEISYVETYSTEKYKVLAVLLNNELQIQNNINSVTVNINDFKGERVLLYLLNLLYNIQNSSKYYKELLLENMNYVKQNINSLTLEDFKISNVTINDRYSLNETINTDISSLGITVFEVIEKLYKTNSGNIEVTLNKTFNELADSILINTKTHPYFFFNGVIYNINNDECYKKVNDVIYKNTEPYINIYNEYDCVDLLSSNNKQFIMNINSGIVVNFLYNEHSEDLEFDNKWLLINDIYIHNKCGFIKTEPALTDFNQSLNKLKIEESLTVEYTNLLLDFNTLFKETNLVKCIEHSGISKLNTVEGSTLGILNGILTQEIASNFSNKIITLTGIIRVIDDLTVTKLILTENTILCVYPGAVLTINEFIYVKEDSYLILLPDEGTDAVFDNTRIKFLSASNSSIFYKNTSNTNLIPQPDPLLNSNIKVWTDINSEEVLTYSYKNIYKSLQIKVNGNNVSTTNDDFLKRISKTISEAQTVYHNLITKVQSNDDIKNSFFQDFSPDIITTDCRYFKTVKDYDYIELNKIYIIPKTYEFTNLYVKLTGSLIIEPTCEVTFNKDFHLTNNSFLINYGKIIINDNFYCDAEMNFINMGTIEYKSLNPVNNNLSNSIIKMNFLSNNLELEIYNLIKKYTRGINNEMVIIEETETSDYDSLKSEAVQRMTNVTVSSTSSNAHGETTEETSSNNEGGGGHGGGH